MRSFQKYEVGNEVFYAPVFQRSTSSRHCPSQLLQPFDTPRPIEKCVYIENYQQSTHECNIRYNHPESSGRIPRFLNRSECTPRISGWVVSFWRTMQPNMHVVIAFLVILVITISSSLSPSSSSSLFRFSFQHLSRARYNLNSF